LLALSRFGMSLAEIARRRHPCSGVQTSRQTCGIAPVVCGAGTPSISAFPALPRGRAERRVPMHPFACARCRSRQNKCAQDFRSHRYHPAFRTRCASGLLRALPGGRSSPGAEDAVRRPVGVANPPPRGAPYGTQEPHDLGRRASVVVSLGSRRSRSSGLERTLCTRRTFASGLAPCDLRSGLTLPRHRIPPRDHGRRERPSQWGGTRWIIVLLGILSRRRWDFFREQGRNPHERGQQYRGDRRDVLVK
jgi:hypothetical protein